MLTYSIAIRTLGRGGDVFRRELEDIAAQTVQPDKVLIYIADGCTRPDFRGGNEEYVWVKIRNDVAAAATLRPNRERLYSDAR